MKKLMFLALITLLVMGTAFAQGWGGTSQPITVNGILQLQNGQIAVATGNTAYFVPTLGRYIGFIDGLREGAAVSIVGYASGNYLEPSRVTIDGRDYDFQAPAYGGTAPGYGGTAPGYGYGPMYGGYGHHGGGMMGRGGYGGYGHHGGRW